MKTTNTIIRILLGLLLLIIGLNKFLHFIPMPEMHEPAQQFMSALSETGYVLPAVAIIEIVAGIFIIINKYQALALIVMFPVILSAFLFHLFLDKVGIGTAVIALTINIYLLFINKSSYSELLKV